MKRLNELLHELGISKVKLAKFLGVSRQMVYNYLELDDINKLPKDKKVLLLNLLGVKTVDEIKKIKVNTDYIMDVETRLNSLIIPTKTSSVNSGDLFTNISEKNKILLINILELLKDNLEDDREGEKVLKYLYHYLQAMDSTVELKYVLAYFSKATGFVKPLEFAFDEDQQFIFESILFSAMTLYNNGTVSKSRIAESHKRFVNYIDQKIEEKLSRTVELNKVKTQALKELNISEVNENNLSEVLEKMVEIESRKILDK
ncbi:MAG: transcriptional regulator [Mycoplasmatota bacterium]